MKLLIPEYQQGGAYTPPFKVYRPLALPKADAERAAKAKDDDGSDLTDKDLVKMLEHLDGLPSDMAVITKALQNFYVDNMSDLTKTPDTSNIAVRYISILNQVKTANFNKKEYDNAYDQVSGNGGINEVAINDRGQFVCVNADRDYKLMTPEELKESDEGYTPLTNSELLALRAQDVSLANNNAMLSVVQNGIGMGVVTDMILKAISDIGSSEDTQEGYVRTPKGRLIQGFEDFKHAVQEAAGNTRYDGTVDDLYKYSYLTKTQAEQASDAMAYIYNALPANAKTLLKAKSDLTEDGAKKMVQALVASRIDKTQKFTLTMDTEHSASTAVKKAGNKKSAGEKDDTDLKNTQLVDMVKSIDGVRQTMTVDRGDGVQMTVTGRQFNLITGMDGKPVSDTSIAGMLSQSGIQGIVKNMQNITFGDQKVSPEALKGITYNNTGVMRVNLPVNPDGSVRLSVLESWQKAEATLDALGRKPTEKERAEAYENAGLTDLLKADGTPDENKFGAFLVTEGYTTDALSGVRESDFVKEYRGDEEKAIEVIKQSLKTGEGKDAVTPEIDEFNWINPADWFGNYDKIYKAAVYIPIDNNTLGAARLDGQELDYDEGMDIERKYQDYQKQIGLGSTSADALNNSDNG